jgi:hypothetical protein
MKSISTNADFDTMEACLEWANQMSDQFKLPLNHLSISLLTRKYDYKSNKYTYLDKPIYNANLTLRAVKEEDQEVL